MWKRKHHRRQHTVHYSHASPINDNDDSWLHQHQQSYEKQHTQNTYISRTQLPKWQWREPQHWIDKKKCWITNWLALIKSKNFQFCCGHFEIFETIPFALGVVYMHMCVCVCVKPCDMNHIFMFWCKVHIGCAASLPSIIFKNVVSIWNYSQLSQQS